MNNSETTQVKIQPNKAVETANELDRVISGFEDKALAEECRQAITGVFRRHLNPPEPIELPPDLADCPPLPASARLDPGLSAGASPWLDAYTEFSRKWSPRAYDGFHEACGLWVLSTVAARRVKIGWGGTGVYPSLYIVLAARTSLFAKSTTADIATQLLRAANLNWLLLPSEMTPQKLLQILTPQVPTDYGGFTAEQQEITRFKLSRAAQRGWRFDEFGQLVAAMLNPRGYMSNYRGVLRTLYDCPPEYSNSTIARGTDEISAPYLSLLASMTPADLISIANKKSNAWWDGFLARLSFVTPPPGDRVRRGKFPKGERVLPDDLISELCLWHYGLGLPTVEIVSNHDGTRRADVGEYQEQVVTINDDAAQALDRYDNALIDLVELDNNQRFDGSHSRFLAMAIRIAGLLASISNNGKLELRHWAKGQEIAERWRAGLHSMYEQVNTRDEPSYEAEQEERVLRVIYKLHRKLAEAEQGADLKNIIPTPRNIKRGCRGSMSAGEVDRNLKNLVSSNVLEERKVGKASHYFPVG